MDVRKNRSEIVRGTHSECEKFNLIENKFSIK